MSRPATTPVARYLDTLIAEEHRLDGRAQERMNSSVRLEATGRRLEAKGARNTAIAFGEGARALAGVRARYLEEGLARAAHDREARIRLHLEDVLSNYLAPGAAANAAADVWSGIVEVEAALLAEVTERRRAAL